MGNFKSVTKSRPDASIHASAHTHARTHMNKVTVFLYKFRIQMQGMLRPMLPGFPMQGTWCARESAVCAYKAHGPWLNLGGQHRFTLDRDRENHTKGTKY